MKKISLLLLAFSLFSSSYLKGADLSPYLQEIEMVNRACGIKGIDAIYLINLKERPEKLERMQELVESLGLEVTLVSGINGWALPESTREKIVPVGSDFGTKSGSRFLAGQLGCFLSHISVWKDAYERGFEKIWVLEDDGEFWGNLSDLEPLLDTLSVLDPEWDILYTDPTAVAILMDNSMQ